MQALWLPICTWPFRSLKTGSLVGVLLDVSTAYDNVILPLFKQKMHQLSIPVRLINVILNLFSGRTCLIQLNGDFVASRNDWKGFPQWSVISSMLYNIYIYDLERSVNCLCGNLLYADDLTLYAHGLSFDDISFQLNSALYYLAERLADHGLSLPAPKSGIVVALAKSVPHKLPSLYWTSVYQSPKVSNF